MSKIITENTFCFTQKCKDQILRIAYFKRTLLSVLVLLAIGGIVTSVYYYQQYQEAKKNPNLEMQKESRNLIDALGQLMELPTDETPTIATITDKEKLRDQPFFARAENGDKLFAYTKAMQAILFRPSINKIINIAPITISQPTTTLQDKITTTSKKVLNTKGQ